MCKVELGGGWKDLVVLCRGSRYPAVKNLWYVVVGRLKLKTVMKGDTTEYDFK